MTKPPHRTDLRLFLDRFDGDTELALHIGRTGFGEMTVGELRAELGPRPCRCNQGDQARDRSHDRGDEAFCRDSFEAAQ